MANNMERHAPTALLALALSLVAGAGITQSKAKKHTAAVLSASKSSKSGKAKPLTMASMPKPADKLAPATRAAVLQDVVKASGGLSLKDNGSFEIGVNRVDRGSFTCHGGTYLLGRT